MRPPLPWLNPATLADVALGLSLDVIKNAPNALPHLLNVSYEPTRELYQTLNLQFVPTRRRPRPAHPDRANARRLLPPGPRGHQRRTGCRRRHLGLSFDIEALQKCRLVAADWA